MPTPDAAPEASADVEDDGATGFLPDVPRDQPAEPPVDAVAPDAMVAADAPPSNTDAATADAGTGSGANDGGCGWATPGSSPRAGSSPLGAPAGHALVVRRRTKSVPPPRS